MHNFKVVYFEIITLKIGLCHQNIESGSFTQTRMFTATVSDVKCSKRFLSSKRLIVLKPDLSHLIAAV